MNDPQENENLDNLVEQPLQNWQIPELINIIMLMSGNLYVVDINGICILCNKNLAEISGAMCGTPISPKQMIGKLSYNFMSHELAEKTKKINAEIIQTKQVKIFEEDGVDKQGKQAIYFTQKIPILNSTGDVEKIVGISVDITDKKRAEQLKTQQEILQKSLTFATLMAGSMAHELRTPLQQISSYIDLVNGTLTSTKQSLEEKESFLNTLVTTIKKIIKDSTETISDMLLKVRSFASGEIPKHTFEDRSITTDIEDFLENYPFENNEKDLVNVIYKSRFKYKGSKILTTNILNNIVKNALRAIKECDKEDATITIETITTDSFNQLVITDTATGVSEEFLNKMFNPFETKKSTQGGTGLGLALCKMLMESYGGNIAAESELGKYTRFILNFPKL